MSEEDRDEIARVLAEKDTEDGDVPLPQPRPNVFEQAKQQYPVLGNYNIGYKENLGGGPGFMESYPPGETGTVARPRPQEFPLQQFGVENYRAESKPSDIMADVTSHHLVNVDPVVKQAYQNFASSLQPFQHDILAQQYQYARQNEGETRPYGQWLNTTGIPGFFRGHAFGQWPEEFNQRAYTPQQRQSLDAMVKYLRGGR